MSPSSTWGQWEIPELWRQITPHQGSSLSCDTNTLSIGKQRSKNKLWCRQEVKHTSWLCVNLGSFCLAWSAAAWKASFSTCGRIGGMINQFFTPLYCSFSRSACCWNGNTAIRHRRRSHNAAVAALRQSLAFGLLLLLGKQHGLDFDPSANALLHGWVRVVLVNSLLLI